MYIDNQLIFEEAWDLARTASTDYASGCIDLGSAGIDVGSGEPIYCVINVTETFTSGGSAYVQFLLLEDAETGIDGSSIVLLGTELFAMGALTTASKPVVIPVPPGVALQYLGLGCSVSGATTTAGTVDAYLTKDAQTNIPAG